MIIHLVILNTESSTRDQTRISRVKFWSGPTVEIFSSVGQSVWEKCINIIMTIIFEDSIRNTYEEYHFYSNFKNCVYISLKDCQLLLVVTLLEIGYLVILFPYRWY